jgi:hypothetical protein
VNVNPVHTLDLFYKIVREQSTVKEAKKEITLSFCLLLVLVLYFVLHV